MSHEAQNKPTNPEDSRLGSSHCYAAIASKYTASMEDVNQLKDQMKTAAPKMVSELCERLSLRQVARRMKRSPSYLSLIVNGHCTISPESFLVLVEVYIAEKSA